MISPNQEEVIQGVIQRITYQNEQNGYTVFQIKADSVRELLTVVGTAYGIKEGATIVARGTYKDHPKFGRQLNAVNITETLPTTKAGIAKYLGSGLIKGIGPETAKKIVDFFGKDTLEIIYQDPQKLTKVPGLGLSKARTIAAGFGTQKEVREIMQFLVMHGLSPNLSGKIYQKYENKSIEILKNNPYRLARDFKGIGFIKADEIGSKLGIDLHAPARLQAGIEYTLERAKDDGHCFLPQQLLIDKSHALLRIGEEIPLEPHLNSLIQEARLIKEDENYYLPSIHRAEEIVTNFVINKISKQKRVSVDIEQVKIAIDNAEKNLGIEFSLEQKQAVNDSLIYKFIIITGGPGCGKTTLIKALSQLFKQLKKKQLLCAPTGRAAQRMTQVCDITAKTIHRLLGYNPISGHFLYGLGSPFDADVIIVDEASMIDIKLAASLCQAIPAECTLILVGDKDQLPSVGPGRLFGDLITCEKVRTITLSKLFRRAEESTINLIAHTINSGNIPEIPEPDGVTKVDAYFINKKEPEEASETIEKLVADQIPKKFGFSHDDILVLTPTNRGELGTQVLNKRLQTRLNPETENKGIIINNVQFRVGDKVCQRVNNYNIDDAGVFNGDTGKIIEINPIDNSVTVDLWDGRIIKYSASDLPQLSLAYAITVHRSQGSEIPCVILALHDSHYMLLEKQLLYTAVTRAKKLLIVIGSKRALSIASQRAISANRYTAIKEKIEKLTSIQK